MSKIKGVSAAQTAEVKKEAPKEQQPKSIKVPVGQESSSTKANNQAIEKRKAEAEVFLQKAKEYGYNEDYNFSINNDGYVVISPKKDKIMTDVKSDFNVPNGVLGKYNNLKKDFPSKEIDGSGVYSYDLADVKKGSKLVVPAANLDPDKPISEKLSGAGKSAVNYIKNIPSKVNSYYEEKNNSMIAKEKAKRNMPSQEKFKLADKYGYNEYYDYKADKNGNIVITVKDETTLGRIKNDFNIPDKVIGKYNNMENFKEEEIGDTGDYSYDLAKAKEGVKIVVPATSFVPRERNFFEKFTDGIGRFIE